jgi:homoaconitate hydratase
MRNQERKPAAGQTVVEKIAEYHLSDAPPDCPVRAGEFVSIWPRHVLTHDNSAAVIRKFDALDIQRIRAPRQPVLALDHDIQNLGEANRSKYRQIEEFAREHGLDFYPAGTGIGHQLMIELGYVHPGSFVVASDSHATTYGALGAVGTPVVRTDAAMIWATGEFWWQVPRTVQVVLEGTLPLTATGKDVIIALCGLYNRGETLNAAVEFTGPGLASLSMEARLTIANMATEWGALVAWFPVDAVTLEYLEERCRILKARGSLRLTEGDLEDFRHDTVMPDHDAVYAARITLDLSEITPHVSGPDTVQAYAPLAEIEGRGVRIDKAYLVSCTNARLGDLRQAAQILRGRHVAEGVSLYVAAASREIQEAAEAEGLWKTLLDAGARPLPPGCGPCIGLGEGTLAAGEVGISATNRNFKGRMGSRDATCYLASPAVVAASAVAGKIAGPGATRAHGLDRRLEPLATGVSASRVDLIEGFPAEIRGRWVLLDADNLNTDGIYGKDYTYREDMTREAMARVVFGNFDPTLESRTEAGDLLVGGWNFGTGSSREQAVTALQAKGYPLVVAASFSQTYLRNAFNNGFICVECPGVVERIRAARPDRTGRFWMPGDVMEVGFATGTVRWRGESFPFVPLGRVPQSLVVAGGVENLLRQGAEV